MKKLYLIALLISLITNNSWAKKEESFTFKPKGTIRLDYLKVNNDKQPTKDRFFFRDVVIGGKGKIFYDFKYRIDLNYSNTIRDRIQQAYVEYMKFDPFTVKVGRFFPAFFFSYDRSFNEWPAVGAIVVQLKDGVQLNYYRDKWNFKISYGNSGSISKHQAENKRDAVYGRFIHSPLNDLKKKEFFVFGASNSYMKPKNVLKYKAKPESRAKINLLNTGNIHKVNYGNITNGFFAYSKNSFSSQVEYLGTKLNRDSGYPNLFYHGGYAQIAYFLTGESKVYSNKKGEIRTININDPVFEFGKNTGSYGKGAWEIAAKYSTLNLNSKVKSGKLDTFGLGVNWFLNEHLKFSNDFLIAKTDKYAAIPNSTSKIAVIRMQLEF